MPALEDAEYIPDQLRQLEVSLNDAFDTYRELCVDPSGFSAERERNSLTRACKYRYYEGGLSSVYLWTPAEEKEGGFAGVVLLKKSAFHLLLRYLVVLHSPSSFIFPLSTDFLC